MVVVLVSEKVWTSTVRVLAFSRFSVRNVGRLVVVIGRYMKGVISDVFSAVIVADYRTEAVAELFCITWATIVFVVQANVLTSGRIVVGRSMLVFGWTTTSVFVSVVVTLMTWWTLTCLFRNIVVFSATSMGPTLTTVAVLVSLTNRRVAKNSLTEVIRASFCLIRNTGVSDWVMACRWGVSIVSMTIRPTVTWV